MRKDLKTGIILGSILSMASLVLISVFSSNVEERRGLKNSSGNTENIPKEVINLQSTTSMSARESQVNLQPRKVEPAPLNDSLEANGRKPEIQIHVVCEGETLSSISIEYYGNSNMWQEILSANRDILKDANRLRPGMKLVIPTK